MNLPATVGTDVARLADLYLSGQNRNTRGARARDLRVFGDFLGIEGLPAVAASFLSRTPGEAHALALEWRNALREKGLAPATVNRHLSSLRSFVKLGRLLGLVTWTLEIPFLRAESYRDTRGPGLSVIRHVLRDIVSDPAPSAKRDTAILWLLVSPALRVTEVCSLDVADVDLPGARVLVLRKGRVEKRWVTIPAQAADAIREWIESANLTDGPLFTALDNRKHGNRLVRQSVNRICAKYGLGKPHGLRHSGITAALDETNGDVRGAQKFAGHASPTTTMVYDDDRTDLAGEVARKVANAIS